MTTEAEERAAAALAVMGKPADLKAVYLGDGVYATFDGYHIWLHLNSHLAPRLVALDSAVMFNLTAYAKYVQGGRS